MILCFSHLDAYFGRRADLKLGNLYDPLFNALFVLQLFPEKEENPACLQTTIRTWAPSKNYLRTCAKETRTLRVVITYKKNKNRICRPSTCSIWTPFTFVIALRLWPVTRLRLIWSYGAAEGMPIPLAAQCLKGGREHVIAPRIAGTPCWPGAELPLFPRL
jgi:hypothetical protein